MSDLKMFIDPPVIVDTRQETFVGPAQDKVRHYLDGMEIGMIGLQGFKASAVDLGWLNTRIKNCAEQRWPANQVRLAAPKHSPVEVQNLILQELPKVVQRLKRIEVIVDEGKKEGFTRYSLKFTTKDDFGWYEYGFEVVIR